MFFGLGFAWLRGEEAEAACFGLVCLHFCLLCLSLKGGMHEVFSYVLLFCLLFNYFKKLSVLFGFYVVVTYFFVVFKPSPVIPYIPCGSISVSHDRIFSENFHRPCKASRHGYLLTRVNLEINPFALSSLESLEATEHLLNNSLSSMRFDSSYHWRRKPMGKNRFPFTHPQNSGFQLVRNKGF